MQANEDFQQASLFPESSDLHTLIRKSLLYKSGLGFYCINPVQGCSHGCRYPCYAWMMGKSHGRIGSFEEWCTPKVVSNAYQLLQKELARLKVKPDSIHLCLSTDPFMTGHPEITELSLQLIGLINSHDIPCSVLSKGALPAELADKERFPVSNMHGISLISLDETFRKKWEPGTTPYRERIRALHVLHENGCRTRVHMEPYPTPNIFKQDLEKILHEISFADEIFFGRWNYNKVVEEYKGWKDFYREMGKIVKDFCRQNNIRCTTS